jgi:copper chaperone CopZ
MLQLTLAIEGMSCSHCLNAVNQSLAALPGVSIKSVRIGRAELEYDSEQIDAPAIAEAVRAAGYPATPITTA